MTDQITLEQVQVERSPAAGTAGCTPAVQYFRQELDKKGYGHCLCRAFLAAKDE